MGGRQTLIDDAEIAALNQRDFLDPAVTLLAEDIIVRMSEQNKGLDEFRVEFTASAVRQLIQYDRILILHCALESEILAMRSR